MVSVTAVPTTPVTKEAKLVRAASWMKPVVQPAANALANTINPVAQRLTLRPIIIRSLVSLTKGYRIAPGSS